MMRPIASRVVRGVVPAVFGLLLASPRGFAADSCGGGCPTLPSNARAVSATATPLAAFPGNVLAATLKKGKAKKILMVEGMLTDGPITPVVLARVLALGVDVNGLLLQPSPAPDIFEAIEDCGAFRADGDPDGACTVTGNWWLDMDDPANAALLGVPITITLVGGDLLGGAEVGAPVDISLRVRFEKK